MKKEMTTVIIIIIIIIIAVCKITNQPKKYPVTDSLMHVVSILDRGKYSYFSVLQ
jgi:hypothetical protein